MKPGVRSYIQLGYKYKQEIIKQIKNYRKPYEQKNKQKKNIFSFLK